MVPCLVTIKNGVVDYIKICKDSADLEARFEKKNRDHGRETNSEEMDDGYVELEDVTICMTWADSPDSPDSE